MVKELESVSESEGESWMLTVFEQWGLWGVEGLGHCSAFL